MPKYWLKNSTISDGKSPSILKGYKLAFEFFRFVPGNIKISCRSMYPSPYEGLDSLRKYLGLIGTQTAPTARNVTASPVVIASSKNPYKAGSFDEPDFAGMAKWLLGVLQDPEEKFKDFIFLAPGFW